MNRKGFFVLALVLVATLTGCPASDESATLPPPPAAPKNVVLTPTGPHHAKLSWTTSSSNQFRFIVERSENGSKFTQVAEVDSASHEFIDDGVSPATTYVYQIYAEGFFGKSAPAVSSEYIHPYLDACTTPPPSPSPPLRIFYDLPISGLNYSSWQSFSVTDGNGAFEWDQASTLPFSIGYVNIGSLNAGDKPGLKTLADNRGMYPDITLTNLLRLFIALDEDSDTTNGIQLPCSLSLAYGKINPSIDYALFPQQETVYRLTGGTPLPSAQEAKNIYVQYLFQDYTGHYELTWNILIDGMFPINDTVPFDLDTNGKVVNTAETIIDASVDPHDGYRLKIVDLAPLALVEFGYYKMEITGYIKPDQSFDGEVIIKNYLGNDLKGTVTGGRI